MMLFSAAVPGIAGQRSECSGIVKMDNAVQWLMVFLQPMTTAALELRLADMGVANPHLATAPIFGFLLFVILLMLLLLRNLVIEAVTESDRQILLAVALGMFAGCLAGWPHFNQMLLLYANAGEGQFHDFGWIKLPGFALFHRGVMPYDLSSLELILERERVGSDMLTALTNWVPGARGLFIYPTLMICLLIPSRGLRAFTLALILMVVLPSTLPIWAMLGWAECAVALILMAIGLGLGGWALDKVRGR